MDKIAFKQHVAHPPYSLPVVAEVAARFGWGESADAEERGRVCDEVEARLGYPCFVKPANLGSSVGVSRCPDRDALDTALREAASFDPRVVVEQGVDAREIELAVLGDGGPSTRVSPAGEIILPPGRWYDYETKYEKDDAGLQIPAEIDASLQARLQELALRAFRATGAHGLARVDFFVERGADEPRVWLNELNTLPGFTSISMYPKLMEAAGVPYRELITRLAELALARHTARTSLRSARR